MIPISQLIQDHTKLAKKLRKFSFGETLSTVAGLFTLPEYYANNLRLEAFAHLACVSCAGTKVLAKNDLSDLLGAGMADSPLCPLEDPIEDVFIGNASLKCGDFRVFQGLQESGDFWMEQCVGVLLRKNVPVPIEGIRKHALALLRLSEAVADRTSRLCAIGMAAEFLAVDWFFQRRVS